MVFQLNLKKQFVFLGLRCLHGSDVLEDNMEDLQ